MLALLSGVGMIVVGLLCCFLVSVSSEAEYKTSISGHIVFSGSERNQLRDWEKEPGKRWQLASGESHSHLLTWATGIHQTKPVSHMAHTLFSYFKHKNFKYSHGMTELN